MLSPGCALDARHEQSLFPNKSLSGPSPLSEWQRDLGLGAVSISRRISIIGPGPPAARLRTYERFHPPDLDRPGRLPHQQGRLSGLLVGLACTVCLLL